MRWVSIFVLALFAGHADICAAAIKATDMSVSVTVVGPSSSNAGETDSSAHAGRNIYITQGYGQGASSAYPSKAPEGHFAYPPPAQQPDNTDSSPQ